MTSYPTAAMRHLPATIPAAAKEEIAQFAAQIPDGSSCLVTGSLVEGLGNAHSDVDFYLLQPESARARPVAIGVRNGRYVDCEHLPLRGVTELAEQFDDPAPAASLDRTLRDFNRYYRIAIGIPLVTTDEAATVLRRCSKQLACERFAEWSATQAFKYLARAAAAHQLGHAGPARLLLREAALWHASRILAESGEGYPSLKWTETKAARRFGPGSTAYRDCLDGYLSADGDLATDLNRLRQRAGTPTHATAVIAGYVWALADGVRLVTDGEVPYLVRGRKSIARLTGVIAPVIQALSLSASWADAVGRVSGQLSLPEAELAAASYDYLSQLRKAGFLTGGPEGGRRHADG
jgi:hypothetical protein